MEHDERVGIARDLAALLVDRHADGIVAVGVHGSVARGDDGAHSDLDLAVVIASADVPVRYRNRLYRGLDVDMGVTTPEEYIGEATRVGPYWAVAADQYVHHLALHDPGGFFPRLKDAHEEAMRDVPPERFLAAAGSQLVDAVAFYGKAATARDREDQGAAVVALTESLVRTALAVGLMRRQRFHNAGHAVRVVSEGNGPDGFTEQYRVAVTFTSDVRIGVGAMGRALEALLAHAGESGVPFSAERLEDFL